MQKSQKGLLSQRAYSELTQRIITLELAPGSQVDENHLADVLAIGRTPLREALFRLVADGLVDAVPKRGFFVKPITIKDVKALFEARMFLERACAVLAAKRAQKHHIKELHRLHQELQNAMKERNYLEVTLLNSNFHRIMHAATDNIFIQAALQNLQSQALRLAYISSSTEMSPNDLDLHYRKVNRDHKKIIACLETGNEQALIEQVTQHLRLFQSRVIRYLSPDESVAEATLTV